MKMTAEEHDALKFGRRFPRPPRWAKRPGPAPAPLREKVGVEEVAPEDFD